LTVTDRGRVTSPSLTATPETAAVTRELLGHRIGLKFVEEAVRDRAAGGVLVVEVDTPDESSSYEP
jgi:hypothetical protein